VLPELLQETTLRPSRAAMAQPSQLI
jgi:hypothetical protein